MSLISISSKQSKDIDTYQINDFELTDDFQIEEIIQSMKERLVTLFLPVTYEDAANYGVINNIFEVLENIQKKYDCIDQVVLGLDTAKKRSEFEEVKSRFSRIPRSVIIRNDSPEMQQLYKDLQADGINLRAGKGRNMWTGLGYHNIIKRENNFMLHDCDIVKEYYSEQLVFALAAPIVLKDHLSDFSKAYYTRLTKTNEGKFRLCGRVVRLLVFPMIKALREIYGELDAELKEYLQFFDQIKYPLSGEFAMSADFATKLRVQTDWGLETSTINFLYEMMPKITQVNLGIYDHKHSDLAKNEPTKGLNRMAEEVARTVFEKVFTLIGGWMQSHTIFRKFLKSYHEYAKQAIAKYNNQSIEKNWDYDVFNELEIIETFNTSIKRAFDKLSESGNEEGQLSVWDSIDSRFHNQLIDAVNKYN